MLAKRVHYKSARCQHAERVHSSEWNEQAVLNPEGFVLGTLRTSPRPAAPLSTTLVVAPNASMSCHLASLATLRVALVWWDQTHSPKLCGSFSSPFFCGGRLFGPPTQRCSLRWLCAERGREHATLGHMLAGLARALPSQKASQTPVRRQICWRNYNASIPHNGLCFECQSQHPLLNMFRNIMLYSSVRMCIIWSCMSCRFNWMNLIESAMLMIDSIEIIWTSVNISWAGQAHTKNLWAACWKYVTA